MRPIKFRAWDGEKMRTSFVVHNEHGMAMTEEPCATEGSWLKAQKDWVLMQFTGLHDKNGKEIYEGDIIQKGSGLAARRVIEWKRYRWNIMSNSAEFPPAIPIEVIGNIYENPELLK